MTRPDGVKQVMLTSEYLFCPPVMDCLLARHTLQLVSSLNLKMGCLQVNGPLSSGTRITAILCLLSGEVRHESSEPDASRGEQTTPGP